MTYRERRERRAENYRTWAGKREATAAAVFKADEHYTSDYAFNTQPGHIPERARLIKRHDRQMESLGKAASMRSRADGIEDQLASSIYDDDDDAIERLRERIARLEAERDQIKAYNKTARAGAPDLSLLDDKQRADLASTARHSPYMLGKGGQFPSYHLTNLSGNINRQKKRLARLEREAQS